MTISSTWTSSGAISLRLRRRRSPRGNLLDEVVYRYDADGDRQMVSGGDAEGTYRYENVHQLREIETAQGIETYSYDAGGRVETVSRDGEMLRFEYDENDQLTKVSDVNGNRVVEYTYDSEGRRVEVTDAQGKRDVVVAPTTGGLNSPFLIVKENEVEAAFAYAGDRPLARVDEAGNPLYYLTDAMGSVIGLVDGNGQEVAEFRYDSFGNLQTPEALPSELGGDFRFQGQWLESNTDLYHFRARYYDPETGRFVSRDPVEVIERLPESSNPYQFVYNNPYVYSDPSGEIAYSISEVNVSRVIQDLLNTMKVNLIDTAKQKALDKARGVVGQLVSQFISTVNPYAQAYGDVIDLAQNLAQGGDGAAGDYVGDLVEEFVMDVGVCPILTAGGFDSYLWREPSITISGKPTHNGSQCNDPGSRRPRRQIPNPDFVISAFPPKKLQTGLGSPRKGWLVGDVKISPETIKTFGRRGRQWNAINNFAKARQYVPSAFYITFFGSQNKSEEKRLEGLAANRGVILKVLPLIHR